MKYKIVLLQSEEGYSVSVPGLPGCWSQGDTEQEAIENIREVVKEYLGAVKNIFPNGDGRGIDVIV